MVFAQDPRDIEANNTFVRMLDDVVDDLDMGPKTVTRTISARRRGHFHPVGEEVSVMTLVEREGILCLGEDPSIVHRMGPRRGRRAREQSGVVLRRIPFERLPPSKIYEALEKLDRKLTPALSQADGQGGWVSSGLRRFDGSKWMPIDHPSSSSGRVLLFIHGTFSNNDHLVDELRGTPSGIAFLNLAKEKYAEILAFDHRTLGVSPAINARELALLFSGCKADVDVVCHSRGGLVARWWAEALDQYRKRSRRIVFVGAPLAGTSLAAPPNIRATLNLLANISKALGVASSAAPFLVVATGLFQVVSSITSLAAKTPVVDAAVALVPGLDAMSRIGNNRELEMLRRYRSPKPESRYFAVRSNFESSEVGWRFWEVFRDMKMRTFDAATNQIFKGPNDLVVDVASMDELQDGYQIPNQNVLDFRTSSTVHHTNYFRQKETADFLHRVLL